jgi:hypothetical protein
MVFNNTSSPLGWTKQTSTTDDALRLTSGTVGTGGTVAFETALASQTPTITMTNAAVTLTTAQLASHTHVMRGTNQASAGGTQDPDIIRTIINSGSFNNKNASTNNTDGGTAHTHTNTGACSAINLDVSYVDIIIGTKD